MERARVNRGIDKSQWKGILIIAEQRQGKIQNITYELLGEALKLKEKAHQDITVAVAGYDMDAEIEALAGFGADKIVYLKSPLLGQYTTDGYVNTLSKYILQVQPEIVLVGASTLGRDLAPRLAARVGTGLTADCTGLDIGDDGNLLQTRPAFGGNLMATIICRNNRPQMSTVRPGVMEKARPAAAKSAIEVIDVPVSEEEIIAKVVDAVIQERDEPPLTEASIIVSGGRGIKGPEGFDIIRALAKKLGGVVGSSRACVDSGWISPDRQVGQTGTTVRPKLYIACGISGAIQHLAGMSESETIVAINKDPNAPIHQVAHYSIVGDLFKVIPALMQAIDEKESIIGG